MYRLNLTLIFLGLATILNLQSGCNRSSLKSALLGSRESSLNLPDPAPLLIWHESYEEAMEESRRTGKPVLADFTMSDSCHWCVKLKQDVFETTAFRTWAADRVVLLELDYPKRSSQAPKMKQQNQELATRYGIFSYPSVLILDSAGKKMGSLGYLADPHEWTAAADKILAADK